MKTIISFTIAIILTIANVSKAQYAGIEVYPDASTFLFAGNSYADNHYKIDLWATPSSEVGMSFGPKFGNFATGLGFSMGVPEDDVDLMYINTDLGFGLDFGPVHWQSFNLYQFGQNDVDDFILARQWFDFGGQIGIVGHNIKSGADDWKLNWGPFYSFGQIAGFSNNKLGITKNLNGDGMWAVWVMEL